MAPIYPEAPTRWCSSGRTGSDRYTAASWMPLLKEKGAAHVQRRPAWSFIKIGQYIERITQQLGYTRGLLSLLCRLSGSETLPRHQADQACVETPCTLREIYRWIRIMWRKLLSLTRKTDAPSAVTLCLLSAWPVFCMFTSFAAVLSYQTAVPYR